MNDLRRQRKTAGPALCAVLALLCATVLGVAGPVHAQTNSPSGGQSTGNTPTQGGTSNEAGTNTGGDGQAGNRTTPGGGGATGGGASGAGETETGGGGNVGTVLGVVALLAVVALGIGVATRHRRVMEDAGAGER
ncbi:MAG TPA: hypothetical protein VGV86_06500 [Acidimicrobiales bacterium]|nr:hypothetical protein [Acidimicrobiales bacterium]